MVLYHASNCEVKMPMLVASNRLLDFGPGFYTTTNREQAVRFAKGVVSKRGGDPFLNVYEFDADAAYAGLYDQVVFCRPDAFRYLKYVKTEELK